MEIHQLRYFVELWQTRSFTKAAERCHVTQPTLSHQIRKLEDELGQPLWQRRTKGLQPTEFGRSFLQRALTILGEIKAAEEEAASLADDPKGSLHLGLIPTVAPYLAPQLLQTARRELPHVTFRLTEDTTDRLLEAMKEGVVDLALLSLPLPGDLWEITELLKDELLVALPEEHPLAKQKKLAKGSFANEPVILMKEAHCLRGQSLQLCRREGMAPEVYLVSSQIDTLLALVESGLGLSFVPAMARSHLPPRRVALRPLAERYFRTIALVRPRQQPRTVTVQRFMEVCRRSLAPSRAKRRGAD